MKKHQTKPATGMDRVLFHLTGDRHPANKMNFRNMATNIAVLGATGSGKSSSSGYCIASSLLRSKGLVPSEKAGIVVFCFKNDEAEQWQKWAFQHGRKDDIIHVKAGHKDVYNLLSRYQHQEPANAVAALMAISDLALGGGNRQASEKFWEIQLKMRLDRLIRLCQMANIPLNIATLHKIHVSTPADPDQIKDEEFQQSSFFMQIMNQAAKRLGEEHPDFQFVENYFIHEMIYSVPEETLGSIMAMCSGILEPFVSSSILRNLFTGESNLVLNEVFSGKILILDIPVQRYESIGRIAQIMLKREIQVAVQQRDLSQYPNFVAFYIDEAQAFLTKYDHTFLSVGRSSYTGTFMLSQNIDNYISSLGGDASAKAQVDSLLALFNTIIFHANRGNTNDWASKIIGSGIKNLGSVNYGSEVSAGSSQQISHFVEAAEFCVLRTGSSDNNWTADAIVVGVGRVFSNGKHFLRTSFLQPFAP